MFSVMDVDLEKNSKVSHLWVVPMAASQGAGGGFQWSGEASDVLEGWGVGREVFAGWEAGFVCGDG